jgi:hypothetical protein
MISTSRPPSSSTWSRPTLVSTVSCGVSTRVASSRPPIPASKTPISTPASANAAAAASVSRSKNRRLSPSSIPRASPGLPLARTLQQHHEAREQRLVGERLARDRDPFPPPPDVRRRGDALADLRPSQQPGDEDARARLAVRPDDGDSHRRERDAGGVAKTLDRVQALPGQP